MFKPAYKITEYFLSLVEKIAQIAAKIEAKKIKLSLMAHLRSEALERSAHSSTSIEGNTLSLAQVSALNHNHDVPADSRNKTEILNYFNALRWIVKGPQRLIDKKSLLKLHALITAGLLIKEKTGQFKNKQNFVVNEKKIVIYTPPPPKDCPRLVDELVGWVNGTDKVHPIILSAIFHHQLVTIHPFSDGNGRVARAAGQWLLYRKKFDYNHILPLDDFFAHDREKYYEKIQQVRDLDYDFTCWIEYVAQGVHETIEKTYSRLQNMTSTGAKDLTVTPKQEELVNLFALHGSLGSRDIGRLLKINRARVNQLVAPLIEAGVIKKDGHARATRYYLR